MKEKFKILIVDDDDAMARTLADILRFRGYAVEVALSAAAALELVDRIAFDCVLSDIKMPDISGVELFRTIKKRRPDLPVMLMTAYASDSLVEEGLKEGALTVLGKPLDIGHLLTLFNLLRRVSSLVIVDDDPYFCQTLGGILRERGFAVSEISDPAEVLDQLVGDEGVVLLDMKMQGAGGLTVLRQIRDRYPHLPVILVTGYRQEMAAAIEAGLALHAHTCLYKPLEIPKLLDLLAQLRDRELDKILDH